MAHGVRSNLGESAPWRGACGKALLLESADRWREKLTSCGPCLPPVPSLRHAHEVGSALRRAVEHSSPSLKKSSRCIFGCELAPFLHVMGSGSCAFARSFSPSRASLQMEQVVPFRSFLNTNPICSRQCSKYSCVCVRGVEMEDIVSLRHSFIHEPIKPLLN